MGAKWGGSREIGCSTSYRKLTNSYSNEALDYYIADYRRIDQEWVKSREDYELSLLIPCTMGDSTHSYIDKNIRGAVFERNRDRDSYYRFKLNLSVPVRKETMEVMERFYIQASALYAFIKHEATEFEKIMEQVGVPSLVEKRLLEVLQADKSAKDKYKQVLDYATKGANFIKIVELVMFKYFAAQQQQTESTLAAVDATRLIRAKSYDASISNGENYTSWVQPFIHKVAELLLFTENEVLLSSTLTPETIGMWFNATHALAGMLSILNDKHACPEIMRAIQRVHVVSLQLGLKSPKNVDRDLVSNLMQCVTAHVVNDSKLQQFDKYTGIDATTVFMLLQVVANQNAELAKHKLIGTEKLAEATIHRAAGIIQRKFRQLLPRQYAKYCQTYAQQLTALLKARKVYNMSHEASLITTPTADQVLAHTGVMEQYAFARRNLETYAIPKAKYPFTAKAMLSLFSGKLGKDVVQIARVEEHSSVTSVAKDAQHERSCGPTTCSIM